MSKSYNLLFLNEYYGEDIPAMKVVLSLYLEETPKELRRIQLNLESNNMQEVKKLTHKIKTNIAMLGIGDPKNFIGQVQKLQKVSEVQPEVLSSFNAFQQNLVTALNEIRMDFKL